MYELRLVLRPSNGSKEEFSMKFYVCKHCGNIITFLKSAGVPVSCCGEHMSELIPGTTDASLEKHVPVVTQQGGTVNVFVGAVEHPMIPEHFIEWIALETRNGSQVKHLVPGQTPSADFALAGDDKVVAAYAFCNIHGLWKS